jgi:uncharacterized protein involved in tolerance to divalent cations
MMRLLQYENGEFSLTMFPNHKIPEYAILSHTWGRDSEEVDFIDIVEKKGRDKSGYKKLRFCAEQAARDGLLYFWIDTCCINKSSSAELDEAIRSMFRWYGAAARCYVYLSDVPEPKGPASTVESAFAKSRWFTRGWTLQELIAPKSIEFFSQKGEPLGHKGSRLQQIHEITGVAIEALRGRPISQFSVADRMSWAARRETTREEDAAYCLLGIFEIHIPIMYGEGKQNALARLQREIRILSDPASVVPTDAPWIVPFERNPRFTGRETQLAQLEDKLFAKDHTARTAVTGLGGVGKTALVLELLFRTKNKHMNCSIIWIPATNSESLHQGYLEAAHQLEIPGWEDGKADVKKLVQEHLSNKYARQWLLVFDNADDLDMWTSTPRIPVGHETETAASLGSDRLIDCLPRNKQGCIIFTTRDRRVAVKLAQENVIELLELDNEAATELLKKHLARPGLAENQRDVAALLTELTNLPLAIVQAAAYINENGIELADYISLLKEKEEEIIDLLSEEFEDNGRYRNVNNPVATTWLISFERIRQRDSLAAEYLSFMACIETKDIPQSLLPPGPSRKKEMDAVGTLGAYSFVSRRPADLALDLHRLVHLATRNWLRKEGLLVEWTERAIERLEDVFPDNEHKNRAIWRIYLPHVQYVLESDVINKEGEKRLALIWRYGMCLCSDGRWNEAEESFTQILEVEKKVLGEEHPSTLTSMANLASTYSNQGRWKEAEELEVQVKNTSLKILGKEHPSTLTSMANLASTYRDQGRWKEAEELEVQVKNTSLKILGKEHPSTLTSMANLASTYINQGRWREAEELQAQELDICSRILGENHPDTLISMQNLAVIWKTVGRNAEAVKLLQKCVVLRKQVLGDSHPYTLSSSTMLIKWQAEILNI